MPVTRTTKKTMRPRRKYVRKPKMNFAQRVRAIVQKQQETKSIINAFTERSMSTFSAPQTTYNLNNTTQGTAGNERIGDTVTGVMMNIRGSIHCAHQIPIVHRILVIEKNFQADPLQDLLEDNNGNYAPAAQDLQAVYARINTHKYKVLASRTFHTGTRSNTANDYGAAKLFNMTFKTPGKYVYDEAQVRPQKRNIVLLVISRRADNDEVTGAHYELTFNSKWYFKDA